MELSAHNAATLDAVEQALAVISFDDNSPSDSSEAGAFCIGGDLHSRWADKACQMTLFRNGMMGCVGEHSCYDGTISMLFEFYILVSMIEAGEPDWDAKPKVVQVPVELRFDLDDHMRAEIGNTLETVNKTVRCDTIFVVMYS